MKTIVITQNDAGQRADRFLSKAVPALPPSLLQRYLRIKRIKLNGKRCQNAEILREGDRLTLYINDEFFTDGSDQLGFLAASGSFFVLYEDENLLLIDKRPGLVVHEDESGSADTLINRVKKYLYEKGEYDPSLEQSFAPALCNRIDRNTGGIVIAAKNAATLRVVNALIKERLIHKFYLCIVHGALSPAEGTLKDYLLKNEETNLVTVSDKPLPGYRTILTKYQTLAQNGRFSLLEAELLTGRTHQIRAHLAHAGHPLLGDAKYGQNKRNKGTGFTHQALYSYKLVIDGKEKSEHLSYLNQKVFQVEEVWFQKAFLEGKIK